MRNFIATTPITDSCTDNNNLHDFTEDQRRNLQHVIDQLSSFEKNGLGKTGLVMHTIDGDALPIKQRHYVVSPAVQKEIYQAIDRMAIQWRSLENKMEKPEYALMLESSI